MPSLKIVEGAGKGDQISLGERATLGRSRDCDVQIKDVESSRNHAEVLLRDGQYYVKDLESSNGTFVNGARIDERTLQHGDRIEIGAVTVEFIDEAAAKSDTPGLDFPEEAAAEERFLELPGLTIIERLGRDDLSETYQATDVMMDRPVVVEIIDEAYCTDPEAVLDRIKSAARLEHPALACVYSAGRQGELVFFSRGPAEGRSMWELCGKLPSEEGAQIAAVVAGALAQAHKAGIVHGSIRPDRIVRTDNGHVKLLGLGLPNPTVGTLSSEPDLQRRPNRIAYMAPEQVEGGAPTPAADIYSLGAVLYHLLCGRVPFGAISEAELAPKITSESIIPVLQLRPKTPRPLAAAIDKMLSRSPADRPGSMEEVQQALEGALHKPGSRPIPRTAGTVRKPEGISAGTIIIVILTALLLVTAFLLGKTGGIWFIKQGAGDSKAPRPTWQPALCAKGYSAETGGSEPNTSTPDEPSRAAATPGPGWA